MESRTIKEIIQMDNFTIKYIIDHYKQYDNQTIILIYAEAKRRNLNIKEKQNLNLNEFAVNKGFSDIDTCLTDYFKNNIVSYEEFYKNNSSQKVTGDRYPALITIASIYQILAFLVAIAALIIIFKDITQVSGGSIISLIALVLGSLIVLGLFAVAEGIKVFIDIEYNTRQAAKKE